jgi:proline iminopeptidase
MKLRTVKTDNYTITDGHLDVGDGHKIYYEKWGNPKAKTPILLFHGGPGSELKAKHKYNFDPKKHLVIGFDQRGCGNSLPHGKLENNTTQNLIEDTVKLLDHLGIDEVYINSGSWGSTMALLFTIEYPKKVKSLVIRGIFTGTKKEIDWLDNGLFKNHYPEVWEKMVDSVPREHRSDPTAHHYSILKANGNKNAVTKSAKALDALEGPLLGFDWAGYSDDIKSDPQPDTKKEAYDYVPYQIYAHYLDNNCFLPDDYILNNAHKITVPVYMIQGRYDMCCPPVTAYNLDKKLPNSKLFITLGSHGHDPENRSVNKSLIETVFI